ncbi:GntR family transcriptional regulator [Pseudalkalibacillus decolorationis]|uniref:GntR family transcriptional regulator n=1 Tax=Pseudalkalibacillus decolorationis TaxID=163879 RepID=UPI002147F3D8|nr:GntR family transcriptional regulator [Pseudalkalibacillus decolorationis]
MKVNRSSLYKIIYDDVVDKILSKTYESGDKLPSESELERLHGASRTPVRQALMQLEADGFIFRLQGKGSFVSNQRPTDMWTKMTGFMSHYKDKWEKISSRTIQINSVQNDYFADLLNVHPHENLTYLRRIRYFSDTPILYLEHFISPKIPTDIFNSDINFLSLNEILLSKLNVKLIESNEEIEAVQAPEDVANALHISAFSPVLKITRISKDENKQPIDINVYYVNTDKWKYRVNFIE